MALGSVEGWQQHEAIKAQNFSDSYWMQKITDVQGNMGTIDRKNKTLTAPTGTLLPVEQMWNQYLKIAQNKGISADYVAFKTNYDKLKAQDDSQLLGLLNTAKLGGIGASKIRKIIKKNPELSSRIEKIWLSSANDPELQAAITPYLSAEGSDGILDTITENPLIAGGLGYGGYKAFQKFGSKAPTLGTASMLPFSGEILSTLMQTMGIEEDAAKNLGNVGQVGLGLGLGGAGAIKELGGLTTAQGRAALKDKYYQFGTGSGGRKGRRFKAMDSLDDFHGQKIPPNIKKQINDFRNKNKLKGGKGKKLGGKSVWSQTSMDQYRKINPKASVKSLAPSHKLVSKLSKSLIKKSMPGKAIALASALLGGYNLLSEE